MRRRELLTVGAGLLGAASLGTAAPDYEPLGFAPVAGAKEVVVGGRYAYAATTDGFAVVDLADPGDPSVVAERRGLLADREAGPLEDIWDVAVEGDRLLVVGPAHGGGDSLRGMAVYDVADPTAPALSGFHATDFPIHNADLAGGVAYLTAADGDRNPLVTVDAATREELGRWSLLDHGEAWSEVSPRLRPLHDVSVTDGTAALAYWDAGTWLLDVSDPADPSYVGAALRRTPGELAAIEGSGERAQLPGNDHYAAVNDAGTLLGVGREAWDVDPDDDRDGGPGGVDIYDIAGDAPQPVATIDPPPTPDPTYGGTWTTAHNFGFAGDRLYTSWYRGGVKIHDISDPAEPRELAWWRRPAETSFWTAQHADDAVVAASHRGDRAGVFTFPDRAGDQPDPPALTTTTTAGATRTPTATATTTAGATRTPTATATTTAGATRTPTTTTAPETAGSMTVGETTTRPVPGFGVPAAAAALGLAAWRRLRGG